MPDTPSVVPALGLSRRRRRGGLCERVLGKRYVSLIPHINFSNPTKKTLRARRAERHRHRAYSNTLLTKVNSIPSTLIKRTYVLYLLPFFATFSSDLCKTVISAFIFFLLVRVYKVGCPDKKKKIDSRNITVISLSDDMQTMRKTQKTKQTSAKTLQKEN